MSPRTRKALSALLLLLLALALLLFIGPCRNTRPPASMPTATVPAPVDVVREAATPVPPVNAAPVVEERLTAATLAFPPEVDAGAPLPVTWSGPGNAGDYVTIVRPASGSSEYGSYRETREGAQLELTAPIEPGSWEVRYVAVRSKTVLARGALVVRAATADVTAPAAVVAGAAFAVQWRGPNRAGDYLTVVPQGTPDGQYRSYAETAKGATLTLTAPIDAGEAEVRYVTGTGAKVLARRAVRVTAASVTISAPAEAVAGSRVTITWAGPRNTGDYLTIVPKGTRDGSYGNYTDADKGSPLAVTAPIEPGAAEIRYMSGQGARVLARRELTLVAATIALRPPARAAAGSRVAIEWTGPNHAGDYLTVVRKGAKDGAMHRMTNTTAGSPAKVDAPGERGAAEVRYMSGQGNRVLARAELELD